MLRRQLAIDLLGEGPTASAPAPKSHHSQEQWFGHESSKLVWNAQSRCIPLQPGALLVMFHMADSLMALVASLANQPCC